MIKSQISRLCQQNLRLQQACNHRPKPSPLRVLNPNVGLITHAYLGPLKQTWIWARPNQIEALDSLNKMVVVVVVYFWVTC